MPASTTRVGLIQALGGRTMTGWCVLRASGSHFSPEDFLAAFPFPAAHFRENSLNITIGDSAANDLVAQIEDAMAFLNIHSQAVKALVALPGVEASLDFGVLLKDTYTHSVSFPPSLTALAGELGIGLDACLYRTAP